MVTKLRSFINFFTCGLSVGCNFVTFLGRLRGYSRILRELWIVIAKLVDRSMNA